MKFIVLGTYNEKGLSGYLDNPNDDRHAAISSMMKKAGGKLANLYLNRGKYDVVAICEAPDFTVMGALKMLIMKSGAISEMEILEVVDFNEIANKGAAMMGAYKAPGTWL